jgi:hypothetical protein
MSAAQDVHRTMGPGGKGPRKLAVARHAHVDAVGWVLLGFVMGAGAAIAVLMNADFARRPAAPAPAVAVREAPPLRFTIAPLAPRPAVAQPPTSVLPGLVLALPPTKPAAQTPTTAAKSSASPAHKPSAAAEPVAEDAAAAGMTSRIQGQDSDLY